MHPLSKTIFQYIQTYQDLWNKLPQVFRDDPFSHPLPQWVKFHRYRQGTTYSLNNKGQVRNDITEELRKTKGNKIKLARIIDHRGKQMDSVYNIKTLLEIFFPIDPDEDLGPINPDDKWLSQLDNKSDYMLDELDYDIGPEDN